MKAGFVGLFGGVSIIAAAASIFASGAQAAPIAGLPPTEYYNAATVELLNSTIQSDGGHTSDPASEVGSNPYGPTSWNFGTSNNYSTPSVSASAQAGPGISGSAESQLTYYIRFLGADGNVSVNVQAAGGVNAEGPNNNNQHNSANAYVIITPYGSIDRLVVASPDSGATGPGLHTFSFHDDVTFAANVIYKVFMTASAQAGDGHSTSAYTDPLFNVLTAGYTLETSGGVGPFATPIPAALPLFTTALGGLGLLGWRRKNKAAALSA